MITNALSVDVEEYFHAELFARATNGSSRSFESRIERSMDQLLQLVTTHGARGTFFVLGEIASRHPAIVRQIYDLGHEVGCHSDRHESVSRQTPERFRDDVRSAKARIEDVIGDAIVGYRAPNFSIGRTERWAFRILAEEGFQYDSSIFPIRHDRYGEAEAPRFPYVVWEEGSNRLLEFPIGTARLFGVNLPIGGGGHFRLWPFTMTRLGIQRVNIRERRPIMFYLHPWELDAGQPRPPMPWKYRFRHYVGVEREPRKLDDLLARFSFNTARHVLSTRHAAC